MEDNLKVKYKIFLHKLDTVSDPTVKSVFYGPSLLDPIDSIKFPKSSASPIRYSDAVDYFDVNSRLHWYKMRDNRDAYKVNWRNDLLKFRDSLSGLMSQGKLKDIITVDITDYVENITGYSNKASELDNSIGFELAMDERFVGEFGTTSLKIRDIIEENQIIEICVNRDQENESSDEITNISPSTSYHIDKITGRVFYTEFMGFIGSLAYTERHGSVNTMAVTVYGLNKLLSQSNTINKKAIYDMFEEGIELTNPNVPVFITNWNDLNVLNIFTELMISLFSAYPENTKDAVQQGKKSKVSASLELTRANAVLADAVEKKQLYLDDLKGKAPNITTLNDLEQAIKNSLSLQEIAKEKASASNEIYNKTLSDNHQKNVTVYFNQEETDFIENFKISFLTIYVFFQVRKNKAWFEVGHENKRFFDKSDASSARQNQYIASVEHGEHKAYNESISSAFEMFYSEMQMPTDLLSAIREIALYDIFETRDNMLICRPPRYNQLYVDNLSELPKVNTSNEVTPFPSDQEFMIPRDKIITQVYHRSDIELISRCDTKNMLSFIGTLNFFGDSYTDPNTLFKYGLRVEPPQENPNVGNPYVAELFSALYLYRKNALTRQINIEVPNDKKYYVGNLYLIQMSKDDPSDLYVGYLMESEIVFGYGKVTKNILKFAYVRKVSTKLASAFSGNEELEMIYSIYREVIQDRYSDTVEDTKTKRIALAQKFVLDLSKTKSYLYYFNVIPSILDIMLNADENESKFKFEDKDKGIGKSYASQNEHAADSDGSNYYFDMPPSKEVKNKVPSGNQPDLAGYTLYKPSEPYTVSENKFINKQQNGYILYTPSAPYIPYVDISYEYGEFKLTKNVIQNAYESDLNDLGYQCVELGYQQQLTPKIVSSPAESFVYTFKTPFKVGSFNTSGSSTELVDKGLINLLSSIDVSLKKLNKKLVKFPDYHPTPLIYQTYTWVQGSSKPRIGLGSGGGTSNRYDYFILQHLDDFVWDSYFYTIAPITSSSNKELFDKDGLKSSIIYLYQMPTGRLYYGNKSIYNFIGGDKELLAIDIYKDRTDDLLKADLYKADHIPDGKNGKATLTQFSGLDSSIVLEKGDRGSYSVPTSFLSFMPCFSSTVPSSELLKLSNNYYLYDMEKAISPEEYNDLVVGYRSPSQAEEIAKKSSSTAAISTDAHQLGLAVDISTMNMRSGYHGRVNVKYLADRDAIIKPGLHGLINLIVQTLSTYRFGDKTMASNRLRSLTFPGQGLSFPPEQQWMSQDRYIHIESR